MISLYQVSKSYGRVKAVDNLTMNVDNGTIIGLFGPNGAGKSTVIRMIAGLSRADQGEVLVDDKAPRLQKERIAYLPESNYLYHWWTLRDAVAFIRNFYNDWDEERYQYQLHFLNLEEGMQLDKISKGQLAKCKLLLATSRRAPYLLLDEPLSGIDLMTREEIINTLIRNYCQGEKTIIISTHEIDEVERLVDQVYFIDRGQIRISGNTEELRIQKGMSLVEIMKEAFKNAE
jgi:ABC-2 type transport system ATP-binding protein